MSAVDPHEQAHRLKSEFGYGARRIATELGISRHAATQLLARPLPQPVADTVRPVAEPVGRVAEEVADRPSAAAEQVAEEEPCRPALRLDLVRRPRLLANLTVLVDLGLQAPDAVDMAVAAFAEAYRHALALGEVHPGQAVEVAVHVRPAAADRRAA
ncbi:hypothetical protein ACWD11_22650 [Streptomyces sp. NPDC002776]